MRFNTFFSKNNRANERLDRKPLEGGAFRGKEHHVARKRPIVERANTKGRAGIQTTTTIVLLAKKITRNVEWGKKSKRERVRRRAVMC